MMMWMRGIVYGTALSFLLVSDGSARQKSDLEIAQLCGIAHEIMPLFSVRHCKKIVKTERGRNCDSAYLGCYEVSLRHADSDSFSTSYRNEKNLYYELRLESP